MELKNFTYMKSRDDEWSDEMMTPEQRKIVTSTYNHLMEKENRGWDGLDDCLNYLDYLDNDQLHREADVIYEKHLRRVVKCKQDHPIENCFIPMLIDASGAILELYKETNSLHPKNRYILQYYVAMTQAGIVVVE